MDRPDREKLALFQLNLQRKERGLYEQEWSDLTDVIKESYLEWADQILALFKLPDRPELRELKATNPKELLVDYGSEVMALVQKGKTEELAQLTNSAYKELVALIPDIEEKDNLIDALESEVVVLHKLIRALRRDIEEAKKQNTEQIDAMLVEARRTAKKQGWSQGYETGKEFATINMPNLIKEAEEQERERVNAELSEFVEMLKRAPEMHGDIQADPLKTQEFIIWWQALKEEK